MQRRWKERRRRGVFGDVAVLGGRRVAHEDINNEIRTLVEAWCDRREFGALGGLLPHWVANNGLTDGWTELAAALRSASTNQILPADERDTLKRLWVELDTALRTR